MKEIECPRCHKILEEYNDFECYDKKGNDSTWNDMHKEWICNDCWNE